MKKQIIICLLCIVAGSLTLSGQEKGDIYISGSASLSGGNMTNLSGTSSEKSPLDFEVGVSPRFGYFVADNLALHLGVGYSFSKSHKMMLDASTNRTVWSIIPGISYYVGIVDGRLYYTPGLDLSLGFGKANFVQGAEKEYLYSSKDVAVTLYLLSFEYRPAEHFGISFRAGSAGYTYSVTDNGDDTSVKASVYSLGLNLNTSLGFRYYF